MDIVARWPGSAHDQNIFNNSTIKARLEVGEFGDGLILADSGYSVQVYMIPPLRNPTRPEERLFNESQIRTRTTVERSYGVWKRRFPVLSLGLRLAIETTQDVIVACAVLHNIAIDMNEGEPPQDPNLPAIPQQPPVNVVPNPQQRAGSNAVREELVEYFRRLL